MTSTLYIVGAPLAEHFPLSAHALEILEKCSVIIGESKPVLDRYLKPVKTSAERFHLDPPRRDELSALSEALTKLSREGGSAALLSDVGMPLLFDPGTDILENCRKLGFCIRSVPGPTSWATACAVSGWNPPFLIHGFLNRDKEVRQNELKKLKSSLGHIVLMETPYRFRKFLEQLLETFDPKRSSFLAWEIGKPEEIYFWGSLIDILRYAEKNNLEKGEFVLLLKAQTSVR